MRISPRLWRFPILLTIFLSVAFITACQPVKPTATPLPAPSLTPTKPVTVQPPTPTQPPVDAFPLYGKWTGTALNGSYKMELLMDFNSSCNTGEVCGRFDVYTIPCAGTYTLEKEENGEYIFSAGDFIGSCSPSQDSLKLDTEGNLQYISRGDYGETTGTLSPIHPLPVIYDDDGSPDGAIALMYFLNDPRVSLKEVNISYGEANPGTYAQLIGALLDSFGRADIPLGAGKSAPLGGNNAFPDWMREKADNFWNQPIPETDKVYPVQDAAQLMVNTLNNSPEPLSIFISGPCTNLAEALRLDPGIKDHIQSVFIMGGALYVKGNLSDVVENPENSAAEWNIYADAQAASEVFQSGLDIHLVPLDATQYVTVSHSDTEMWRSGGKAASFAADLYDQQISGVGRESFYCWDATTAELLVNPGLCQFTRVHAEVGTSDGAMDGVIRVVDSGEPNINACLKPDAAALENTLNSILSASR